MPTTDKDLMTRLTELVEEHGHQWKKIAPTLAVEGYRDRRGKPYSDHYLRNRMKKQKTANYEESSEASEHGKLSEPSDPDIRELARAVISLLTQDNQLQSTMREALGSHECTLQEQRYEMPPQPQRNTDRRWVRLAGTCYCLLVERFHDERRTPRLSV
ncbi:hypothetical protein ACFL2Q_06240 [Thermodesulfobacteriota bacterium]